MSISPSSGARGLQGFVIFKTTCTGIGMANLCSTLAPLLRKIDICAPWDFCQKYNFGQLLIKAFFWYNRYFWQCSALKWTCFPITVLYLKIDKFLVPPCSTSGGDKDMPTDFIFRKFNFIQFLFKAFVNTIGTFGSKSTESRGLISTREKIRTKFVRRMKNPYKSAHSAERSWRNTDFWKKKSGNTEYCSA